MKPEKSWFSMKARADGRSADIAIMSDIGDFGVTALDFHRELVALGDVDTLYISITSNGGDISQGFAIYNQLADHLARKVVTVNGLAASMASVIAMVGNERIMPKNSMLMIHNPWGGVQGSSEEIISFGQALDKMKTSIVNAYSDATGLTAKKITALMNKETWLDAAEAKALGFITKVSKPAVMNARFDISNFHNVPRNFKESNMSKDRNRKAAAEIENDDEFEGGADTAKSEKDIRAELLENQKEIRALCKLAGKPELAESFIDEDKTVAEVLKALDEAREKEAEEAAGKGKGGKGKKDGGTKADTEISARNNPRSEGKQPEIDPVKIYDHWNKPKSKVAA